MRKINVILLALIIVAVPMVAGVITETQKLITTDGLAQDRFGAGINIDGNTSVIDMQSGSCNCPSSVYIFRETGGVWSQSQKISAPGGSNVNDFGVARDLQDGALILGSPRQNQMGTASGAVYIYEEIGGTFTHQQTLVSSDLAANDRFGQVLTRVGEILIVSATNEAAGGAGAGAAYVFELIGGSWVETQKLTASDAGVGDGYGATLAFDGNNILIGAGGDDDAGADAGAIYVYTLTAGTWTETQKFTASDIMAGERFGGNFGPIIIQDSTAVVGNGLNNADIGAVYVFTLDAGVWTQTQKLIASDGETGDLFGITMDIQGRTTVIGAPDDDDAGLDAGAVYVFELIGGSWVETQKIIGSGVGAGDQFSVGSPTISNDIVMIGAINDDDKNTNAGAVYVFNGIIGNLTPPAGLRGTVYQITETTERLFIEVATSPDDTNPDGDFTYTLERDDGTGFAAISTLAAGTADDGVFGVQDSYTGTATQLIYRAITEVGPEYSCTITVDITLVDNSDVCGTLGETVVEGGALFGDEGVFFLGDKQQMAEDLKLTTTGLEALFGVLMVQIFTTAGYNVIKLPEIAIRRKEKKNDTVFATNLMGITVSYAPWGAAIGAITGWTLAVVFSLLPFWTALLTLAVIFGHKSPGINFGSLPQKILVIVLFTLTLEGLMFGQEIAEKSFPTFEEPSSTGFFAALEVGLAVIKAIWGGILFFLNLITFGLPDVPWWVRVPVGGSMSGATIWAIIQLIRGTSNE